MAEPVTGAGKTQFTGYVQAEGGAYDAGKSGRGYAGVAGGVTLEKNSTFVKAKAGVGTAIKAELEAGHEFKLGKNTGLELAGNVSVVSNNSFNSCTYSYADNIRIEYSQDGEQLSSEFVTQGIGVQSWKDGYAKAGASAMLTFGGKRGNLKLGVEGGYRTNNAPDFTNSAQSKYSININGEEYYGDGETFNATYKGKERGAYITPKVEGQLNVSKHLSFVADATLKEGSAGVRWTF